MIFFQAVLQVQTHFWLINLCTLFSPSGKNGWEYGKVVAAKVFR